MNKGKWYLVYTFVNTMEAGTFRDGKEEMEILLSATTEEQAFTEGSAKWAEVLTEATADYEKRKAKYVDPVPSWMDGPFHGAHPNPKVIYKIVL